jgi:hypothetical protein
MDSDMTIEAIFVPITYYTLTVSIDPLAGGTVTLEPSQPAEGYTDGTQVTLTATASEGYKFDHWGGALSGSENPTTISVASATEVTAYFTKPASFPWWVILVGVALFLLALVIGQLVYRLATRRTNVQAQ